MSRAPQPNVADGSPPPCRHGGREHAITLGRTLELIHPAFLAGFTFPDWIRLLRRNRWDVDAKFIPRALVATVGTICTSLLKAIEDCVEIKLEEADEEKWRRPIFILGLGRSGTTHLFHLMAKDPQLCFATRLDRDNPHTLLTLRKMGLHRLLGFLPARRRLMDNVETGYLMPEEDDAALTIMTSSGSWIARVFPRTGGYVRSPSQVQASRDPAFEAALALLARKLVFLHKRRVLFKSPSHTVMIPQLCRAFPQARFVTILRDPFSQFMSMAGMHRSRAMEWARLQRSAEVSDALRLEALAATFRRYLNTRSVIPRGHLIEIRYKDLVADQRGTLDRIYAHLQLDLPSCLRDAPRTEYQPNRHPELSPEVRDCIRKVYRPLVEAGLFEAADLG